MPDEFCQGQLTASLIKFLRTCSIKKFLYQKKNGEPRVLTRSEVHSRGRCDKKKKNKGKGHDAANNEWNFGTSRPFGEIRRL